MFAYLWESLFECVWLQRCPWRLLTAAVTVSAIFVKI